MRVFIEDCFLFVVPGRILVSQLVHPMISISQLIEFGDVGHYFIVMPIILSCLPNVVRRCIRQAIVERLVVGTGGYGHGLASFRSWFFSSWPHYTALPGVEQGQEAKNQINS
jgi:hypothetical protein